jgi:hypothetical protein
MTIICFELSMPNNNAWNGRWSGEGRCHARIKNLGRTKKAEAKAANLIAGSSYYYSFGDGWGASVSVREVTASEAAKIRRKSAGFCGYEWMIESILYYGEITVKSKGAAA